MVNKTNTLMIQTPEGVVFSLRLAGPITRFLAWLVDLLVISVASRLIGTVFMLVGLISADLAGAITMVIYFVISVGYGIVLEWYWRGQTLGKRLFKLRVMDEQGLHLAFSQIAIRNLLRVLDSLPGLYLVGGLACLITHRAQRLGDMAANTVVVRHPPVKKPDLDQVLAGKYNSFHEYPHIEARLRQQAGPREAALVLAALLRRDELEPEARVRLYNELAGYFREMAPFPQEAVEGMSDEQYLRNVVDVLYK